jgi:hypothetical protein
MIGSNIYSIITSSYSYAHQIYFFQVILNFIKNQSQLKDKNQHYVNNDENGFLGLEILAISAFITVIL